MLARAGELGLDEDDATSRLSRLATLEVVDLDNGYVHPDDTSSRY
ncbi:hypothetical protein J2744_000660 [Halorubrum trapanicum]|uniref:Uncharacterized protein n=1 Tax=Halorubrum trapanicum TaxID=29284 RepID=A0A8J7RPN7_9EURY|nr:hypothetical protein [Halorubrum trapanicum]MBP1901002.1 hypothetical protein [Halorubrum trapanicum]